MENNGEVKAPLLIFSFTPQNNINLSFYSFMKGNL